jgi:hypothetical protein
VPARVKPDAEVSGWTIRTLEQSPRLAREAFTIVVGEDAGPARDGELGRQRFRGRAGGPLLLWEEQVGVIADLPTLEERLIAGDVDAWQPESPLERVDARGLDPLPEDEFWPVIDALGGRTWDRTVAAAERALAAHDEEFILRWSETSARKALRLLDALGAGSESLWELGAVLARGRDVYESVVADPALLDPRWLGDGSIGPLVLGTGALNRRRRLPYDRMVLVTTSFSRTHGLLVDGIEAAGETPPRAVDASRTRMTGARALVAVDDRVLLRVVLAPFPDDQDDAVLRSLTAAIASLGGEVASLVSIDGTSHGSFMACDAVALRRRFRGTREEYVRAHVAPDPAGWAARPGTRPPPAATRITPRRGCPPA